MGDFLIDLRPCEERAKDALVGRMRFFPWQHYAVETREEFSLALTYAGSPTLWSPYISKDGSVYAVAGITAYSAQDWSHGERIEEPGGLAAKVVCQRYTRYGRAGLESIGGNYVIIVWDAPRRLLLLVGDVTGAMAFFECGKESSWVFGSHPDLVAAVVGESNNFDQVSRAEFVIGSMLTPPFTFYEKVRAVPPGTSVVMEPPFRVPVRHRYFPLEYDGLPIESVKEDSLADELAAAIHDAVRRRSIPRLGTVAVALSGGLDSRLILTSLHEDCDRFAFTCFDSANREFRTAAAIAKALNTRFVPINRGPDYYAESAVSGARIGAGMGTFANNHFLGVIERLRFEGAESLLTGCYFDYLFKGLPLNRQTSRWTGRDSLAPFSFAFYFSSWIPNTPLAGAVRERWESRYAEIGKAAVNDATLFNLEALRTFPFCYEGDNQQRVIPERLTGWCVPAADRVVIEVYRRIPSRLKLNRRFFLKTMRRLLVDSPVRKIRDANTGIRADSPEWLESLTFLGLRVSRKLRTLRPRLASDGSWPDWNYYVRHSRRLRELWQTPNADAREFFRAVMGRAEFPSEPSGFDRSETFLFVSMLAHKLWLENRVCGAG